MSYRFPSQKAIAELAAAGSWRDTDVVIDGTDAAGAQLQITRSQAAGVTAPLVRRWLIVKDPQGQARLRVVKDFVSSDGCLFTVRQRDARTDTAGQR